MNKISAVIFKIKSLVQRIQRFFKEYIWEVNVAELSKANQRLVRDSRIVTDALKSFKKEKIGFQSVALSYFCTMAVIPFVAVAFAVTNGFGLAGRLKDFLYSIDIGQDVIDWVLSGADTILKSARSGLFGLISAMMFVWLVIWMMMRVETVFNNVWQLDLPESWKVRTYNRNFFKSLGIDLLILFLSPFIILIFFSGSIVYSHVLDLVPHWLGISDTFKSFLGWVIFCASSIMILSAMYKFIPATKVLYRHAFKAALISGVAFTILQYLYLETQVMVMRINAVYGALAVIPLFMVWLRFGWLIILYGAQFSYSFQKMDSSNDLAPA